MAKLLTGNEIILKAALEAGAEAFFGYPITPTTEILTGWAKEAAQKKDLIFLQTEDEPAAGFGVLGCSLGGKKTWTATAGLGHVLMQDPLMVAESMRIPFVMYVGQRGGPSTGTVIYSQQELNLARIGGNGEGTRLVLAPSNLQELYDFTIMAFDWAWRYRLPVIVLGDGYLSKTTGPVELKKVGRITKAKPIIQNGERIMNIRNCYSQEEELARVLKTELDDFSEICQKVEKAETVETAGADILVFAWGSVGMAAKEAVKNLRKKQVNVGLFRPITMRPFSAGRAKQVATGVKKILIVESAAGQFSQIVTQALYGVGDIPITHLFKPAEGITAEEIEAKIEEMAK